MLERIARAIASELKGSDWRDYVPAARAAVRALLEPTLDMLDAALPNLPDYGSLPDDWAAMITHVLKERPDL
jgi:hypothetical protein